MRADGDVNARLSRGVAHKAAHTRTRTRGEDREKGSHWHRGTHTLIHTGRERSKEMRKSHEGGKAVRTTHARIHIYMHIPTCRRTGKRKRKWQGRWSYKKQHTHKTLQRPTHTHTHAHPRADTRTGRLSFLCFAASPFLCRAVHALNSALPSPPPALSQAPHRVARSSDGGAAQQCPDSAI